MEAKTEHGPRIRCSFCKDVVKNRHEIVVCEKCSLQHCLGHRHPESHECAKLKEEVLQEHARINRPKYQAPVKPIAGVKGAKNAELAKKVAFMKLKQQAKGVGQIPATERLYFKFLVKPNDNDDGKEDAFYFSKEWSFGRCVDWLADHLKLINQNNLSSAPKLVICSTDDESLKQFDLSLKLKEAVELGNLHDGDNLLLKYIRN